MNRAELDARLPVALAGAETAREAITVAYLDIDDFKDVNDTYGHAVGDELLRHVARTLETELRSNDIISRIGGDEFVLGLPGTDLAAARAIAERVRIRLREPLWLPGRNLSLEISVSIGLAIATPGGRSEEHTSELQSLMRIPYAVF